MGKVWRQAKRTKIGCFHKATFCWYVSCSKGTQKQSNITKKEWIQFATGLNDSNATDGYSWNNSNGYKLVLLEQPQTTDYLWQLSADQSGFRNANFCRFAKCSNLPIELDFIGPRPLEPKKVSISGCHPNKTSCFFKGRKMLDTQLHQAHFPPFLMVFLCPSRCRLQRPPCWKLLAQWSPEWMHRSRRNAHQYQLPWHLCWCQLGWLQWWDHTFHWMQWWRRSRQCGHLLGHQSPVCKHHQTAGRFRPHSWVYNGLPPNSVSSP